MPPTASGVGCATALLTALTLCAHAAEIPKVECVEMSPTQPHGSNADVIWYDDFDIDRIDTYMEPSSGSPHAARSSVEALGGIGMSMECFYPTDSNGVGNRKIVFGDSPIGTPLRSGEQFTDIYWRIYVKHAPGWIGSCDKMSRATGIVSNAWNQAFISHVWSSGLPLTLDPVTGVVDGQVVTTSYNDFANFRWLGNSPTGSFPVHATEEAGRWVCVESRLKLNTPGQLDGYAALWVDGLLDTERTGMDFRGTYTGIGINAIFLEAYWNAMSTVDQYRWYDDFVVSTSPIGPVTAPATPQVVKAPPAGCTAWELEIASDAQGSDMVWQSAAIPASSPVDVTILNGAFVGSAAGRSSLAPGQVHFCRARQQDAGGWSAWSGWHQPFLVEGSAAPLSPSGLTASAISTTQIDLAWTDNAADETGLLIERKVGAAGSWSQLASMGADTTALSDTGLAAATEYHYRVLATGADGNSAWSNEASATTHSEPVDEPPQVQFTTPAEGATLSGSATANVAAHDPDAGPNDGDGIAAVEFELRRGLVTLESATDDSVAYDWTIDTAAYTDGAYVIRAAATSTEATSGSAAAQVSVLFANGASADSDFDTDGLPDWWETLYGLDPALEDSDGDTVLDGDEDPDGDGRTNLNEFHLMSDPYADDNPPDPSSGVSCAPAGSSGSAASALMLLLFARAMKHGSRASGWTSQQGLDKALRPILF